MTLIRNLKRCLKFSIVQLLTKQLALTRFHHVFHKHSGLVWVNRSRMSLQKLSNWGSMLPSGRTRKLYLSSGAETKVKHPNIDRWRSLQMLAKCWKSVVSTNWYQSFLLISVVYLDIQKAFGRLINQLLQKFYHMGARGYLLGILRSYLNSKTQHVANDGGRSTLLTVHCGVPQGSLLGSILFLV